jgi:hypothetical protein
MVYDGSIYAGWLCGCIVSTGALSIMFYILLKYGARRNSGVQGVVVVRHATFVELYGQNMTRPSTESEPPKYEFVWAAPPCGTMFE